MKRLTKKQQQVIDELFECGGDESSTLAKHNISQTQFANWLESENFTSAIAARIESARRQSQILLSKYIPVATAKLIGLCTSEKEETARKACLDILSHPPTEQATTADENDSKEPNPLSPQLTSKLLAVLAENKPKSQV